MADLFLLSRVQMRRIERYFPLSHGVARVGDRRIVSAIVFVIRNGLRWRDAPPEYGPHETIYNRFVRWSRLGVFNKIFAELARKDGKPERIMIDATHRAAAHGSARSRGSTNGLASMHTSDTHAAQSNIQDGISSDRAISEPSNVQRKTLLPPRPRRGQKRRARTRDEADKEALGAPSCGRSQTSLYNEDRPHGRLATS